MALERTDGVVEIDVVEVDSETGVEAGGRRKGYVVIVNGRPKVVHHSELSFDRVVKLAFEAPPTGENVVFTVTYTRAAGPKRAGTLVEGQTVKIKVGTIFNVTATDKS